MRRVAVALLALLALWLVPAPSADARVGGGQSFGSRSSSSRSYSSSSRSYGGGWSSGSSSRSYSSSSRSSGSSYGYHHTHYSSGGSMSYEDFKIWLTVVIFGVIAVLVLMWLIGFISSYSEEMRGASLATAGPPGQSEDALTARAARIAAKLDALRAVDANFSQPLFLDFAQLLYTRGVQARATGKIEAVAHYLSPEVAHLWQELRGPRATAVEEIVVGKLQIVEVSLGNRQKIVLEIDASMVEMRGESKDEIWTKERWTLIRQSTVMSGGPEKMRSLNCPSCGAPSECRADGTCTYCDKVVNKADFQWRVEHAVVDERGKRPDSADLLGGGEEVGTDRPTFRPRDFVAKRRAFLGRHPEFDAEQFQQHVTRVFLALQEAWSNGRTDVLRRYETDNIYNTHRYWLDRYAGAGLHNVLSNVKVEQVQMVQYDIDAFYESITVRIYASMIDCTINDQGRVVGGSDAAPRRFSEYWTFIAAVGAADKPPVDASCPSCGAPMQLNSAGVCEHCSAVVTSGKFGWVLSRIDQDEVYSG